MSKITTKNINSIIKAIKEEPVTMNLEIGDKTYAVEFKKHLTAEEENKFINRIVGFSFDKETKDFLPELNDVGITIAIIERFTNIELPQVEDTGIIDFEKVKEFSDKTNFRNKLRLMCIDEYITDLIIKADKKIGYIKQINIHKSKLDDVLGTVESTIEKFGNQFDGIDMKVFAEDLHKITGKLGKVSEKAIISEIVKTLPKKDNVTKIEDVKKE